MMEMAQVFHMNKGLEEDSYARNSIVQHKILSTVKTFIEEALLDYLSNTCPLAMGIAELGCGTGENALTSVSEIVDLVYDKCEKSGYQFAELMIYLNDLPGNDFNSVFAALQRKMMNKGIQFGASGVKQCFVFGSPGSFYGRLFPSRSLHFVHSSSSLHWLSKAPLGLDRGESRDSRALNKGKVYLSQTSPNSISVAYLSQFKYDLTRFLESRSSEVNPGGRMVLSLMGRNCRDAAAEEACLQWELFAQTLMSMVSEGLIGEDKVDSFNVPFYAPSPEELQDVIGKEGSFALHRLKTFEIEWEITEQGALPMSSKGERIAKSHRAVMEYTLEHHFGSEIIDDFFQRYAKYVDDHLSRKNAKYVIVMVSMIKK